MARRKRSEHGFSLVPDANIPRSVFNRSFPHKMTFDHGRLYPIMCDEVLPGDSMKLRLNALIRMTTPINPVMDNVWAETFFFFCPTRTLWPNWRRMLGEQDTPTDSTDYMVPVITDDNPIGENSLAEYMGIPVGTIPDGQNINALPFRACWKIWGEWFRDQDFFPDLVPWYDLGDGPDANTDTLFNDGHVPLFRLRKHDYFSSCAPWPQKGDPVIVPLGESAPIFGDYTVNPPGVDQTEVIINAKNDAQNDTFGLSDPVGQSLLEFVSPGDNEGAVNLFADLNEAIGPDVNELRTSFQIQRMLERDARGGTRLVETIRSHFRVDVPDYRLQRSEYLGGGRSAIQISSVPQTSESQETGNTPQGNLAAFAQGMIAGHGFTKSFVEHGYIIGFLNVRADLSYQQGIEKMWLRRTRYDFYWPALSGLGEQVVENREIYVGNDDEDFEAWGYIPRWDEYRYKPGFVAGRFRSAATQSLDPWHLAQDFDTRPSMATYLFDQFPFDRVLAVTDEPEFLFDGYFNYQCARPMPVFGVPGKVDHF